MPKIFISYRREDSQWPARALRDALIPHVRDPRTDIFMDIDNIPLGVNFADHIGAQIEGCDVLLALIGPNWLSLTDEGGQRRLDDHKDFVRLEVGQALKRGIPVVPVLLDGAVMPRVEQLPDELRELAMRHATEVRHTTFPDDAQRLIRGLGLMKQPEKLSEIVLPSPKLEVSPASIRLVKKQEHKGGEIGPSPSSTPHPVRRSRFVSLVSGTVLLAAILAVAVASTSALQVFNHPPISKTLDGEWACEYYATQFGAPVPVTMRAVFKDGIFNANILSADREDPNYVEMGLSGVWTESPELMSIEVVNSWVGVPSDTKGQRLTRSEALGSGEFEFVVRASEVTASDFRLHANKANQLGIDSYPCKRLN